MGNEERVGENERGEGGRGMVRIWGRGGGKRKGKDMGEGREKRLLQMRNCIAKN